MKSYLVTFTCLLCAGLFSTANAAFTTSGRSILLNGDVFEVRGMCYQPAEIGENPSAAQPYGDYFTSNYQARTVRDMANMRKMGTNVVRIYGWTIDADHSAFLNNLYNGGEESLYLLVNRYINPYTDWSSPTAVASLQAEWVAIADELKNYPAVMGILIGNEANMINGNGGNPAFWAAMNQIAGAIKATAPGKLVSVAITDALDQVSAYNSGMTNFDFWGMQIYRGAGFGDFFTTYAAASTKPVIVTEFGYDAYDASISSEFANDAEYSADAMEDLWTEIRNNSSITAGGCVFEYADEWWKSEGSDSEHDNGGWSNGGFIDGYANEEWWGVFRIADNRSNLDILTPRRMFYRIASMWNPPYPIGLQSNGTNASQDLLMSFAYPSHLRDQKFKLEASTDMTNWSTVADNYSNPGSNLLASLNSNLTVSSDEAGEEIEVSLVSTFTESSTGTTSVQLDNGGFETGDITGWTTFGGVNATVAQAGSYALQLTAGGGYSVPIAGQTRTASPGDEFNLSGYMFAASAIPSGNTFGLFKIVFRGSDGTYLEPASVSTGVFGPSADPGAESRPILNSDSAVGTWLFSEVQAVAPANTASVEFLALNVDESGNTMFFDSIVAETILAPAASSSNLFYRMTSYSR